MRYRRVRVAGGTYFFTVALADRSDDLLTRHIDILRAAFCHVRQRHPFQQLAAVVLPDHLHTIWRLPAGDDDFGTRWSLIKAAFSRQLPAGEMVTSSRKNKRERGIWQRRYWEHLLRDENDLRRHMDYIHYNPVKHQLVDKPDAWPYSTLHAHIRRGVLAPAWGCVADMDLGEFKEQKA